MRRCFYIVISLFIFLISGCDRPYYFANTKTTDLSQENINGIKLYEKITDEEFKLKYGTNLKKLDNEVYDYYELKDKLVIAVNKQGQIIRIVKNARADNKIKTNKGISSTDTVDFVKKAYGENFYRRKEEGTPEIIGYVDQEKKITIEFWLYQDKVQEIRLDDISVQ